MFVPIFITAMWLFYQSYNDSFHAKLESCKNKAALAMTGANKWSSTETLYQELRIQHLGLRRWFRKLCLFYKILKKKLPPYSFKLIPSISKRRTTRNSDNISPFKVRDNFFKNYFFPSVISKWNKLGLEIRNSASLDIFEIHLLNFIIPNSYNVFNINNPTQINSWHLLELALVT